MGDSSEGVQVMPGLEGHKGNVCPHCGCGLSKKVMADPANDEEVVSQGVVDLADGKGYLSKEGMGDPQLGTSLVSFGCNIHDVNGGIVSDDNLQPLEELDGATDEASRMVEVGIKNESFPHGRKFYFQCQYPAR